MEQMIQLTSMCEMLCQIVQKRREEKRIEEEQAAKAQNWKLIICSDDDDDYSAITPNEPVDSLKYEFDSSDDQSFSDEDFPEEIFSNPLFEEEIISTKIDPHQFDAEREEKRIEEEQAAKAQNWKLLICSDDDDDYSAITPNEPVDSLSMGDEHLNTISATESDEFIKSCVENLVPNPSESKGENGCDVLACFTTFSNILFDAEYEFDSSDDQSFSDEDFPEEIFSNPLFEEEIISTKIDPHQFDAESDIIESMLDIC
nr:hypothetical protein [Tanacetum cinerariifolium]